jgi:hypothetical protein
MFEEGDTEMLGGIKRSIKIVALLLYVDDFVLWCSLNVSKCYLCNQRRQEQINSQGF